MSVAGEVDKGGPGLDGCERMTCGGGRRRVVSEIEGKLDANLSALSGGAVDRDGAVQAFDDVLGDWKPQAGPAAFGREIRVENPRQVPTVDTGAAIGDRDRHRRAVETRGH